MEEQEKDYKAMYESLKRFHDITHESVLTLQREKAELAGKIAELSEKLLNAQRALDINKDITRNAILRQNELQQSYGEEVRILKDKLRVATNGNIN